MGHAGAGAKTRSTIHCGKGVPLTRSTIVERQLEPGIVVVELRTWLVLELRLPLRPHADHLTAIDVVASSIEAAAPPLPSVFRNSREPLVWVSRLRMVTVRPGRAAPASTPDIVIQRQLALARQQQDGERGELLGRGANVGADCDRNGIGVRQVGEPMPSGKPLSRPAPRPRPRPDRRDRCRTSVVHFAGRRGSDRLGAPQRQAYWLLPAPPEAL